LVGANKQFINYGPVYLHVQCTSYIASFTSTNTYYID